MSDQIRDAFEPWFDDRNRAEYPVRYHSFEAGWKASRLAALEESQPKWLPIETAPKDGTWILVAGPDQTGAGRMVCRNVGDEWAWESADDGYGAYIQPTHWMLLPANPTTERPAKDQP